MRAAAHACPGGDMWRTPQRGDGRQLRQAGFTPTRRQ